MLLASGQRQAPGHEAGLAIASLVRVKLGPTHKIDLQAMSSTGPVDTVRLIREGAADFAILPSVTGHAARASIGSFGGQPPAHQIRAIATLWQDALHLAVRDDAASTGTIDDLLQLKGGKVYLGPDAAGTADANHLLFDSLGLDINERFIPSDIPADDVITALANGRLDAFSIAAMPPSPVIDAMSPGQSSSLVFLDLTQDQLTAANASHWLWTPYTIPAATYQGQKQDIQTIAHANLLAVNATLSDETVYLVTKTLFDNLAYLRREAPLLSGLSLERALVGLSLPLHPGALRYFKEAGLVPDIKAPYSPPPQSPSLNLHQEGYPNADVAGNQARTEITVASWPASSISMNSRPFHSVELLDITIEF